MGHFEVPPYTPGSMRSAYHVRELDVYRLMQVTILIALCGLCMCNQEYAGVCTVPTMCGS